mgnify:CR=1 FL=1|tara:strand:+ start:357 stop:527 length:171 start_codon:yes stop_codon:yes gene_type:complete
MDKTDDDDERITIKTYFTLNVMIQMDEKEGFHRRCCYNDYYTYSNYVDAGTMIPEN